MVRTWRSAAGDLQVHRSLPFKQLVLSNQPFLERTDRIEIEAGIDTQLTQAARESAGVPVPFEEPAANDARHFIDAVTEKEAALVDGEFGIRARQELAVQIDDGHLADREDG